jgi:hypothetical protein
MADSDLVPFGAGIAGDVLSALGLPGGGTLSAVATSYLAKKRREAAEVLIKEISAGRHGPVNFNEQDVEPLIDIVLRFSKAVADGAARENLRLLAQIIAGLKKRRALDPDRFRRWAQIVEDMTRDELMVVGLAVRIGNEIDSEMNPDSFNEQLKSAVNYAGYSAEEVEALLTRVASTGLLSSASAWGGLAYVATPWLKELGDLAEVESVKRERGST